MLTERSATVREARKLTRRRTRDKAGLFLAEGPQAVREALTEAATARPGLVVELFVSPPAAVRYAELVDRAGDLELPVHHADDAALAALSETVTPQGLVAVCRSLTVEFARVTALELRLVPVLAEVRDPGNAGTVIRCADAAGADAVVVTHGSVDPQGGKCVRASAGSLFHLPVAAEVPAADAVTGLRDRGLTILAADGAGTVDLDRADESGLLARPTAWVFGNEAWGLPADLRGRADEVVRVPIYGRAESLNLASAAAVCLYASARALRAGPRP
ncbi:MAG TPA: RNA methyltransferase [Jiangellaceae bacterium]|nr:RNA methyltransferase [Jiangellaceae bacterium]